MRQFGLPWEKKLPKPLKKLATYTLDHLEHISKEFEFPTCNMNCLADLKVLKIWAFEIPATLHLLQIHFALHEALFFALFSSKFFWFSGLVSELITQRSPVRSLAEKFFKFFFLQKSSFLQSNCNILTPYENRNVSQWSISVKNVNESLTDYVKYQIFKAI